MNLPAKKSLGQNFLKSKQAVRDIVAAAELTADDIVLEIGPGKGVLTEALLRELEEKEGKGMVIALEKDDRMIDYLKEQFAEEITRKKLTILHGDALEIKPEEINLRAGNYKIVANIPYYITGQFLRLFLSGDIQPSKMVLLLQKEVVKRIVAREEKESILSISVKAYGTPKYIGTVQAKYFSPEPKVDSAILCIDRISKKFFAGSNSDSDSNSDNKLSEEIFFAWVKKGFRHKRKMLGQNLEIPREKWLAICVTTGINEKARAEDLSIDQWKSLCLLLQNPL